MTKNRINLLATPRNVSTAFMYSFAQRTDTNVVDEPLYAAYLLRSGTIHPGREEVIAEQENDPQKVIDSLLNDDWGKPNLFIKNMCHHVEGLDWQHLTAFRNILFIRNPRQMIASYAQVVENPKAELFGTLRQVDLFEFLKKEGKTPLVLDSGELLKNPELVLKKLCAALEIPFDKQMLSWQAGPIAEDGNWAKHWYANVHKSTGFRKQSSSSRPFPEHLEPIYQQLRPIYEQLAEHSILAD